MNTLLSERSIHVLLVSKSPDDGQMFKTLFERFAYPHPPVLHVQETVEGGKRIIDVYDTDIVIFASNLEEEHIKEGLAHIQNAPSQQGLILLSSESFLSPNSLSYWGVHAFLSRAELTAPHLAQSMAWTLEKVALEAKIQGLQSENQRFHWEIDATKNKWNHNPSLTKFLGEPLDELNQFLHLVPSEDQQKVAMGLMKGIRNQENFEVLHKINTASGTQNVRLSGSPQLSPEGKLTSLKGLLEVISAPEPIEKEEVEPVEVPKAAPNIEPKPTPTPTPTPTPVERTPVYQNGGQHVSTAIPTQVKYTNIAYLKQVSGGDTDIMRKAISKFLETTPEMIAQLGTQLNAQDYDQLGKTAHKLKSSVGLMGMDELQKTMQNIELVAKSKQRLDVLPVLVDRSQKMLRHSLQELEQELKEL